VGKPSEKVGEPSEKVGKPKMLGGQAKWLTHCLVHSESGMPGCSEGKPFGLPAELPH
jgi:hypothetical protein